MYKLFKHCYVNVDALKKYLCRIINAYKIERTLIRPKMRNKPDRTHFGAELNNEKTTVKKQTICKTTKNKNQQQYTTNFDHWDRF